MPLATMGSSASSARFSAFLNCRVIPGLPKPKDRTHNREALRPLLVERLRTKTASEWFRELSAAGVPCGPINNIEGGVELARELGLDPVVEVGAGDDVDSHDSPSDYLLADAAAPRRCRLRRSARITSRFAPG